MSSDYALDRAFAVLADPSARRAVEILSAGPRPAGEIGRELGLAPPAMSRRLRALREAGWVAESHPAFDARVRIYALKEGAMDDLKAWLAQVEALWARQLAALRAHLEKKP